MFVKTIFATVAAAAAVVSAAAIPEADRQVMKRETMDVYTGGRVTWYAGASLDAPACGGQAPNDDALAIAVPTSSPAQCGDWVHLHWGGNMVAAKVVDQCEACPPLGVDATKGVFQALAPLDIGVLEDMHLVVFHN